MGVFSLYTEETIVNRSDFEGKAEARARVDTEAMEVRERGDYFGEVSLMTGEPAAFTIVAVEPTTVLMVPDDLFSRWVASHAGTRHIFARSMGRRMVLLEEDLRARAELDQLMIDLAREAFEQVKMAEAHGEAEVKKPAIPHNRITGLSHLNKVINIDQKAIGRTPRSNPATYTKVFDHIRDLFAQLPESRMRGYKKGRYSFNVKGGRCEACRGDGFIRVEMHFLADVFVPCETCRGRRFNEATLEVTTKGHSIADVLDLSVRQAREVFAHHPKIMAILDTLMDVGLGYIKLGQSAVTLSGGEAQRIKLARELAKRDTGRTLYILDEPTTGLHFLDIRMLLTVLQRLVASGNTVIIIEHNLDVIKTADWVIDLGPEGGAEGGEVVVAGDLAAVAAAGRSYTGAMLREQFRLG